MFFFVFFFDNYYIYNIFFLFFKNNFIDFLYVLLAFFYFVFKIVINELWNNWFLFKIVFVNILNKEEQFLIKYNPYVLGIENVQKKRYFCKELLIFFIIVVFK